MTDTATDHIRAAARILGDRMRRETRSDEAFDAATAHALTAAADALHNLAQAAQADTQTEPLNQEPWPAGVTARILTRIGMRTREFIDATVDIHDESDDGINGRSTARCRPCGWTRDHGLPYRDKVLAMAREHANECTALPNPTASTPAKD